MKKNYLLINVAGKKHGYSFCVYTEYTESDNEEVIKKCIENNLFQDNEDSENADVVKADETDIRYFASSNCIYDI